MFEFAWWWVWLLLPLPWLARALLPARQHMQQPLYLPNIARFVPAQQKTRLLNWQLWILPVAIWLTFIAALAQPQWVGEPVEVEQERREMMIALDLSASMLADDMYLDGQQVTRLEAAHAILAEFIERRHGDRIGLIVYADHAYVYAPITRDLEALAKLTREAQIGLAGQRTALGDAIGLSIRYFEDSAAEERVVLMLTDGMINTGAINAEEAIHLARSHDVKIHTIGIGSDLMIVQTLFGERQVNPSRELDEGFLTAIAQSTGGEYFRARDTEEMENIYRVIDEIEPILADDDYMRPRKALAHWPLAISLLLISLQGVLRLFPRWEWPSLSRSGKESS